MKFSLRDLIIVTSVLGAVLGLVVIAIQHQRVTALRNACENRQRQLANCWSNDNSPPRFPTFSTQGFSFAAVPSGRPVPPHQMLVGDSSANPALVRGGYSWLATTLNYVDQHELHGSIRSGSQKFDIAPFSPAMKSRSGEAFASRDIPAYRCPLVKKQVAMAVDYPVGFSPALGSYFGFAGSHLDPATGEIVEDGLLVSRSSARKGLSWGQIQDGFSHTLAITESIETKYASWYDGTNAWVLPIRADSVLVQDTSLNPSDRFLRVESGGTTLNYGSQANPAMPKEIFGGQEDRIYGPSSFHGDVVVHAFVDSHTAAIHQDIDPTLYMRLVTRASGDPVNGEYIQSHQ